jgi:hypothetical protein
MVSVTGPLAIAAGVLVIGGVLELRDTRPARDALFSLGIPVPGLVARLTGPAEVGLGVAALWVGGRLAGVAVAASYTAFAVVLGLQLRHGERRSCGCFGRLSTRPSPAHAVIDAGLAMVGAVAVVADPPGLALLIEQAPSVLDGVVLAGLVALAAGLLVAVLTVLPATRQAGRPDPDPGVPLFSVGSKP